MLEFLDDDILRKEKIFNGLLDLCERMARFIYRTKNFEDVRRIDMLGVIFKSQEFNGACNMSVRYYESSASELLSGMLSRLSDEELSKIQNSQYISESVMRAYLKDTVKKAYNEGLTVKEAYESGVLTSNKTWLTNNKDTIQDIIDEIDRNSRIIAKPVYW